MTAPKITKRQREVLDRLSANEAFTREKAAPVYGTDETVANALARVGTINKRYEATYGDVYWIRGEDEAPTGACVPAGFVVILRRNITTPSGRSENFFLARAPYDGKDATFRRLLRGWMTTLNLKPKDLLGYSNFEVIEAASPVFNGDHVILDEATPP